MGSRKGQRAHRGLGRELGGSPDRSPKFGKRHKPRLKKLHQLQKGEAQRKLKKSTDLSPNISIIIAIVIILLKAKDKTES